MYTCKGTFSRKRNCTKLLKLVCIQVMFIYIQDPGSIPAQCHMWVEFVVGSRLASMVFLRVLRFSSLCKNQHSKFQFDQDIRPTWKQAKADVASSLNIVIYLLFMSKFIPYHRKRSQSQNSKALECIPLRGSGSVLQDHSDHTKSCSSSKEPAHDESGFISSSDAPWSKRTRVTDPDADHSKGTQPNNCTCR